MEYIIIALLVINMILTIISIVKNVNESNITERLGKLEVNTIKELNDFKDKTFYKERWINENGLEQRLIVTYSLRLY